MRIDNRVELTGIFGGDETHALSAWTSTSRELTWYKKQRIRKLLWDLADNEHNTPFEKSYIQFLVTCDTASHIHLLKHRIGVSINGESARYKELQDDKHYIPPDWDEVGAKALLDHTLQGEQLYHRWLKIYTPVMGRKRAKESARYFLGYTNQIVLDVAFNFRSFMHFQKLRNSEHAQKEIRDISQTMLDLVRQQGSFERSLDAFGY